MGCAALDSALRRPSPWSGSPRAVEPERRRARAPSPSASSRQRPRRRRAAARRSRRSACRPRPGSAARRCGLVPGAGDRHPPADRRARGRRPTALSPIESRRRSGAAKAGGSPGLTTKVEATPRWSVGYGSIAMSTSGPPRSPTTSLSTARAAPAASTQSMRSCTSRGTDSGPPGVQVKPGTRDRVRMHLPVGIPEARVGVRAAHGPVEGEGNLRADGGDRRRPVEVRRRVEVAGQEDRECPAATSPGRTASCSWMAGRRVERSSSSSSSGVAPSRTR